MEISNNAINYSSYYNHYQKSSMQAKSQANTSKEQLNADMMYTELIHSKVEELCEKIKSGDTEKSYSMGSESYTEREWNDLMEQINRIEEQIRELAEREQERLEEQR